MVGKFILTAVITPSAIITLPLSKLMVELSSSLKKPFPVTLENQFTSVTQYYVYKKAKTFRDKLLASRILMTYNTKVLNALSDCVLDYDKKLWDKKRMDIVLEGMRAKFDQNLGLKQLLLNTGDNEIIRIAQFDTYWGQIQPMPIEPHHYVFDDYGGILVPYQPPVAQFVGHNHLGRLLEIIREEYWYRWGFKENILNIILEIHAIRDHIVSTRCLSASYAAT